METSSNRKITWRLIINPPLAPARNMAIDEAIAIAFSKKKVPPTLRLYQWSRPTFSIGSFQTLDTHWLDYLNRLNVNIVRRMTGGQGLLHDREMTYSVIASTKDPLFSGGIKRTFHSIAKGLLAGLQEIGTEGKIHGPSQGRRLARKKDPLCFAATSGYEITARGKKLIGSAQRRWKAHFLQHGSLILEAWIPGSETFPKEGPRMASDKQITLAELLPTLPEMGSLERAMKTGFETALQIHFVLGQLTTEETESTERLIKEKYGTDQWNLYRKTSSGHRL
ncbi:MAG: biotin/lipoate A/B protein ligase family protein [Nitrospira sp.]|nr:lipoate--protein ligase family protein [Candidatus Manganitrophaceae bacterium]HIL34609.1 lipoate--protein ligase family protein [Candidatus Manganitrophaceae bacterium]